MIVDIIVWLLIGLIAGWLASVLMKTNAQQGVLADIVLGIIGAVVGGYLLSFLDLPGASGLSLYSILVAVLGAIVVIAVGRMLYRAFNNA